MQCNAMQRQACVLLTRLRVDIHDARATYARTVSLCVRTRARTRTHASKSHDGIHSFIQVHPNANCNAFKIGHLDFSNVKLTTTRTVTRHARTHARTHALDG